MPPYDLLYLQTLHQRLFRDISKGDTHFCTVSRIQPESDKLFQRLAQANWLEGLSRSDLVLACAEYFGDLNMLHPFHEGNGRTQRILFEHLIINAGFSVSWWALEDEWVQANIDAIVCDYLSMAAVFDRCIGEPFIE